MTFHLGLNTIIFIQPRSKSISLQNLKQTYHLSSYFKHDSHIMLMIKEYKILGRLITFHLGLNMMIFTMIIEYRPIQNLR